MCSKSFTLPKLWSYKSQNNTRLKKIKNQKPRVIKCDRWLQKQPDTIHRVLNLKSISRDKHWGKFSEHFSISFNSHLTPFKFLPLIKMQPQEKNISLLLLKISKAILKLLFLNFKFWIFHKLATNNLKLHFHVKFQAPARRKKGHCHVL